MKVKVDRPDDGSNIRLQKMELELSSSTLGLNLNSLSGNTFPSKALPFDRFIPVPYMPTINLPSMTKTIIAYIK